MRRQFVRLLCSASLVLAAAYAGHAQPGLPAGQWRSHPSFTRIGLVALGPTKVYAASANGLFSYGRQDEQFSLITKVDGLSETGAAAMAYSAANGTLVIGYRTGQVDLLSDQGRVRSIDGLKRANLSTSKQIQAIATRGNLAYLAGDYGLLVIDIFKAEVKFSNTNLDASPQNVPVSANSVALHRDTLLLATSQGIKAVPVSANLMDSRRYYTWPTTQDVGLPPGGRLLAVGSDGAHAYAAYAGPGEGLYMLKADKNWARVDGILGAVTGLEPGIGRILAQAPGQVYAVAAGQVQVLSTDTLLAAPAQVAQDRDGELWVADLARGLLRLASGRVDRLQPNGPASDNTFKLYGYRDRMYQLTGGFESGVFTPLVRREGFSLYQDNFWTSTLPGAGLLPKVQDISSAVVDPKDNTLYLASFANGVVALPERGPARIYADTSTGVYSNTLVNAQGTAPGVLGRDVRISDVKVDKAGNLWVVNFLADKALHVRDQELKWFSWAPKAGNRAAGEELLIDDQNQKWIRTAPTRSALASLIVQSADNKRDTILTTLQGQGGLPVSGVYDMAQDKDGAIWFATGQGVAVLYSPQLPFSGAPYNVTLPIFDGRPLLENDRVTSLVLDGGGRKWMGTGASGLWLFDKDVNKVLAHFTAEDSPLPSNEVIDLAIMPATGELFIATTKGLISYGTASTDATLQKAESSCVAVYPSPVGPDYTGLISITCLPENAVVKITDAGGRLVYEGRAAGGGITWDGLDYRGRRPASGIYLIYASSDSTNEKVVGRFGMVR